jgi:hypothetical protein
VRGAIFIPQMIRILGEFLEQYGSIVHLTTTQELLILKNQININILRILAHISLACGRTIC